MLKNNGMLSLKTFQLFTGDVLVTIILVVRADPLVFGRFLFKKHFNYFHHKWNWKESLFGLGLHNDVIVDSIRQVVYLDI